MKKGKRVADRIGSDLMFVYSITLPNKVSTGVLQLKGNSKIKKSAKRKLISKYKQQLKGDLNPKIVLTQKL